MIVIKLVFVLFILTIDLQQSEGEELSYGGAGGKGTRVGVRLDIKYCSNPPSKLSFIFDDSSVLAGAVDTSSVYYTREKEYDTDENGKDIEREIVTSCTVQYNLSKKTVSPAILAISGNYKIAAKKIKKWELVPFEKIDVGSLLSASSISDIEVKTRIKDTSFCKFLWERQETQGVTLEYDNPKHKKKITVLSIA